jgi:hypothetical protein
MGGWKLWLKGLLAAVVSSASNTIAVMVSDPGHFNPAQVGGLKRLGAVIGVSALVGAALYLKQSPLPNGQK